MRQTQPILDNINELEAQKNPEFGRQYYEEDFRILATGKGSIVTDITATKLTFD